MNIAAAKEIARQLRLRDLGGVIVNDFIDMRKERHRRGVERALARRGQARPRAHQDPSHQPLRPDRNDAAAHSPQPETERVTATAPAAQARGVVKTAESMAIEVMRLLILAAQRPDVSRISAMVHEEVATYLNNKKRREIAKMEDEGKMAVHVVGREHVSPEHLAIECHDGQGREVKFAM